MKKKMLNRTVNNRVSDMGEEKIPTLLLRFSLPATLAMIVMASYNIVDAVFVGWVGSDSLAALSVAFPIQMLLGAIAIGTGVGAASLISRSLGGEKVGDAVTTGGQVILIALLLGLLTTVLGNIYLEPVLIFLGTTPEILEQTVEYLSAIINMSLVLYLLMMLNHTVRAEGNFLLPMVVMIGSAVLNIVLDPIFIFVLEMGIRGAAIATVLAKALGALVLLWYYLSGKSALSIRPVHLKPDLTIIGELYKVGFPTMLIQMSQNITLIVANYLLASFGYVAIAVMGVVFRLQMFALMPVIGISQGVLPIVGFNFGAGKLPRVREAVIKAAAVSIALSTVCGLTFWLFPEIFLKIFGGDREMLLMGKEAIRIMVVMWPLLSVPLIGGSFFQGIGKGLPALALSLMRQLIVYIPFLLLLPPLLDLTGIWLAAPLADLVTFTLAVILVAREFRNRNIALFPARDRGSGPLEGS